MKRVITIKTNRSYYDIEDATNEAITIGELIDILKHYDEDDKVIFSNDNGYTYGYIDDDVVDEVTFETHEEEELRENMDELDGELTDLEARYENPLEDEEMTEEEYRAERQQLFADYGITEEEYKKYFKIA